eukprot:1202994-Pyramimonas_sp.AAC.1
MGWPARRHWDADHPLADVLEVAAALWRPAHPSSHRGSGDRGEREEEAKTNTKHGGHLRHQRGRHLL